MSIKLMLSAVLLLAIASSSSLFAQSETQCSDPLSHQFDFWIGEWNVYGQQGLVGTNSIKPILGGCVLQEMWTGSGGSTGSSFNFYDPSIQQWQQFWVWQNGTTLHLSGEYIDGKMMLEGTSSGPGGATIMNRITWFNNSDGTVRQLWEQSSDGQTWATSFDGMYKKE
ncbi:MAG: hypothetical protein HKN43_05080 [Rhodothermales bacterium]|nr:hypothetical protein [Rhodothermales bacterium]